MTRILLAAVLLVSITEPTQSAGLEGCSSDMPSGPTAPPLETAPAAAPMTTAPVSSRVELIELTKRGDAAAVEQLLGAGTTDPAVIDGFGRTALHYAARLGHDDVMRILIETGAPLDAADADGYTPLLRAIQGGDANLDAVRLLLDAGANRDARAGDVGADELARSVGAVEVVDLLGP